MFHVVQLYLQGSGSNPCMCVCAHVLQLAQFRERIKDQQRKGQEQTNILEVYQHMTSARRALQGAESILDDYLVWLYCRKTTS